MKEEHRNKQLKVEGKRKVYVNTEIEAEKETSNINVWKKGWRRTRGKKLKD